MVKDEFYIPCLGISYFLRFTRFTPPADLRDVDSGGETEDSDNDDDDLEELGREGSGSS